MFPEVINILCQLLWGIINTSRQGIRGYLQPSDKFVLFAKVAMFSKGFSEVCQYPLTSHYKFARGWSALAKYTGATFVHYVPLKIIKFRAKTEQPTDSFKTIRGSSPNNALSIQITNSPSVSHETVCLMSKLFEYTVNSVQ
jgi:hypothetical protein